MLTKSAFKMGENNFLLIMDEDILVTELQHLHYNGAYWTQINKAQVSALLYKLRDDLVFSLFKEDQLLDKGMLNFLREVYRESANASAKVLLDKAAAKPQLIVSKSDDND